MAVKIVHNAKLRNTSICGATETILMHKKIIKKFCNPVLEKLTKNKCEIIADATIRKNFNGKSKKANEKDWSKEYLAPKVSVKAVDNIFETKEVVVVFPCDPVIIIFFLSATMLAKTSIRLKDGIFFFDAYFNSTLFFLIAEDLTTIVALEILFFA